MKKELIGASIIRHPDYYMMHQSEDENSKGIVLDLYGGIRDDNDKSLLDTARRVLGEKSGMWLPATSFVSHGRVYMTSEMRKGEASLEAEIFRVDLKPDFNNGSFANGVAMRVEDLRRAKELGELSFVAAVALSKVLGASNGAEHN